ncbi:MAG: GNAT family N-acetyltransferase [Candidatus Hodarchaeota archaeon]
MLEGELVRLRTLELTDLDRMTELWNNWEIRQYLVSVVPASEEEEEQWIRSTWERRRKGTDYVFAMETLEEREYIGNIGLHQLNWINRSTILGIAILDPEYWGKGYGTDALKVLLKYAFTTLNLNRVELEVSANNERAQRVYKKVGFREVGRRRQVRYWGGKYEDGIILDILREEFLK